MTAEPIGAETAAAWGLIWRAVDDDALLDEAAALAAKLAAGPTQAYARSRRSMPPSRTHCPRSSTSSATFNARPAARTTTGRGCAHSWKSGRRVFPADDPGPAASSSTLLRSPINDRNRQNQRLVKRILL